MTPALSASLAPRACCHCKRAEDWSLNERGTGKVVLRPYGPSGALVCFECAMKPEHKPETDRQFAGRLALAGPVAMLTEEGPVSAAHLVSPRGTRS